MHDKLLLDLDVMIECVFDYDVLKESHSLGFITDDALTEGFNKIAIKFKQTRENFVEKLNLMRRRRESRKLDEKKFKDLIKKVSKIDALGMERRIYEKSNEPFRISLPSISMVSSASRFMERSIAAKKNDDEYNQLMDASMEDLVQNSYKAQLSFYGISVDGSVTQVQVRELMNTQFLGEEKDMIIKKDVMIKNLSAIPGIREAVSKRITTFTTNFNKGVEKIEKLIESGKITQTDYAIKALSVYKASTAMLIEELNYMDTISYKIGKDAYDSLKALLPAEELTESLGIDSLFLEENVEQENNGINNNEGGCTMHVLTENFDNVYEELTLGSLFENLNALTEAVEENTKSGAPNKGRIAALIERIQELINKIWEGVKAKYNGGVDKFMTQLKKLPTPKDAMESFKNITAGKITLPKMNLDVDKLIQSAKDSTSGARELLATIFVSLSIKGETAKMGVQDAILGAKESAKAVPGKISDAYGSAKSAMGEAKGKFDKAIADVKNRMKNATADEASVLSKVLTALQTAWQWVSTPIQTAMNKAVTMGQSIASKVKGGKGGDDVAMAESVEVEMFTRDSYIESLTESFGMSAEDAAEYAEGVVFARSETEVNSMVESFLSLSDMDEMAAATAIKESVIATNPSMRGLLEDASEGGAEKEKFAKLKAAVAKAKASAKEVAGKVGDTSAEEVAGKAGAKAKSTGNYLYKTKFADLAKDAQDALKSAGKAYADYVYGLDPSKRLPFIKRFLKRAGRIPAPFVGAHLTRMTNGLTSAEAFDALIAECDSIINDVEKAKGDVKHATSMKKYLEKQKAKYAKGQAKAAAKAEKKAAKQMKKEEAAELKENLLLAGTMSTTEINDLMESIEIIDEDEE